MNDDIDWLIYADYLDDQNINHFIREDLQNEEIPWHHEYTGCGCIGGGNHLTIGSYYTAGDQVGNGVTYNFVADIVGDVGSAHYSYEYVLFIF
jgi:hypothetical protein